MTDYKLVPVEYAGKEIGGGDVVACFDASRWDHPKAPQMSYANGWNDALSAAPEPVIDPEAPVVGDPLAPKACNVCNGFVPTFSVPKMCSCRHHAPAGTHEMRDPKIAVAVKALEAIADMTPSTCETSLAHDQGQIAFTALVQIKGGA